MIEQREPLAPPTIVQCAGQMAFDLPDQFAHLDVVPWWLEDHPNPSWGDQYDRVKPNSRFL